MNLKDYIHGKRHGKEANRLEREAMNDPFLQDAIDGYESVPGNHLSAIEKLEERLAPQPKRIDNRVWMWAAAAVLVLLFGIPFLLRQPPIKDIQVASTEPKQEEIATTTLQEDSVLVTESFETKEKETPRPTVRNEERKPTEEKAPEPAVVEMITTKEVSAVSVHDLPETAVDTPDLPISEKLAGRVEGVAVTTQDKKAPAREIRIKGVSPPVESDKMRVQGRVVDENNEPLIGATINLKNSTFGTVTDTDGNFAFVVPKETEGNLLASYIGYENKEIPLKGQIGDVVMKADTELLSEVVVVGFGTQRKISTVGSVSKEKDSIPTFGETEFKKYFEENYDKTICTNEPISFNVEFFVNAQGQPGNIVIKENSCPELETEIKRLLLGSPKWSQTNRKITLEITLNE